MLTLCQPNEMSQIIDSDTACQVLRGTETVDFHGEQSRREIWKLRRGINILQKKSENYVTPASKLFFWAPRLDSVRFSVGVEIM